MNISFAWNTQLCREGEVPYKPIYKKSRITLVYDIADGGTLDYLIAKLLPVVTTVRTHLESSLTQQGHIPENFDVTDKFAPIYPKE